MSALTLRQLVPVLLFPVAVAGQIALNQQLRSLDSVWVEPPWERTDKWDPILFKTLSFGHLPAFIDWLWMRSLQDPAYTHVPNGVHPPAFFDLDLATDLDPAYYEAYVDGASHLVVVRDDELGAVQLLKKAEEFRSEQLSQYSEEFREKFWTYEWQIPFLLAYVQMFELEDIPAAAVHFEAASRIPGSPDYLRGLTERLRKPGGHFEVGIRTLQFMVDSQKDEKIREELKRKLQNLGLIRYLHQIRERFSEYSAKARKEPTQELFARFLAESGIRERDPLGGRLHLNEEGMVATTTSYEPVFGLK